MSAILFSFLQAYISMYRPSLPRLIANWFVVVLTTFSSTRATRKIKRRAIKSTITIITRKRSLHRPRMTKKSPDDTMQKRTPHLHPATVAVAVLMTTEVVHALHLETKTRQEALSLVRKLRWTWNRPLRTSISKQKEPSNDTLWTASTS